jgi:hypothetical protein
MRTARNARVFRHLLRRFAKGDQQRSGRRPVSVARRAVHQIDVEQQDVAGLAALRTLCQRIHWRMLGLAAMRARHELGGAVPGPKRVEECQRGNRFGELAVGSVSTQILRAAARTRFAPLDLRHEERLSQDLINRRQHDRQAANLLRGRIKLEQGMAPIGATGNRPLFRRQRAGLEGVAKRPDPGRRNSAAQQEIALVVEQPRIFGVKPTEPGARQKLRDGYRLAQEVGLSRYAAIHQSLHDGAIGGACHRARIRATRWLLRPTSSAR